jgi:beta-glucosidase
LPKLLFPENFAWGVATSAYQVEGAWNEDGRSESIWDHFVHTPGKVRDGSTGDLACDHYHRWPEDVAIMKSLGIRWYRFSISWPRILPDGRGRINHKGLDHYSRLIDSLLEAGITPLLTLYHWELPVALQETGGWPERETAAAFAELAHVVSRHIGDRARHWITHNEPWCSSMLGYQVGVHAPGWQNWPAALRSAHHLLLSHGLAVQAIRSNVPDAEVGIALNFEPAVPASPGPADYHAARRWDGYYFRWYLDPLSGRRYPADMVHDYKNKGYLPAGLDFVKEGDFDIIAEPTDFLGVNYYTHHIAHGGADDELQDHGTFPAPAENQTEMGWDIDPDSLYTLLNRLYFEYRIPKLIVTENGCSYLDGPDENDRVSDPRRIAYLRDHLLAVHRAIQNGVPVSGYLQWTLLDNFEWSLGYTQRFGIVHVDFDDQRRTLKDSAFWYRDVIAANGLEIAE